MWNDIAHEVTAWLSEPSEVDDPDVDPIRDAESQ